MGRVTRRQAAEIAEQLHVDEDAVLDLNAGDAAIQAKMGTPEPDSRAPLGEIEPNSAESRSAEEEEPVQELKKSTRGRKGAKKGGAKGKKNNLAASTATLPEADEVVPDDNESAPSPASEKAAEDLSSAEPELHIANANIQDRSQSPPSAAVRLTRSQLAKKGEVKSEPKTIGGETESTAEEREGYFVSAGTPAIETETAEPADISEEAAGSAHIMDAPASPLPSAVPNVIKNLRTETPAKRSTSNKENVQPESETDSMASPRPNSSIYDALEDAVVAAATPPGSEAHASPRPEDPIEALDDLEDALENASKDIPEVQASPAKPKRKMEELAQTDTAQEQSPKVQSPKVDEKKVDAKKESKKPPPVVRMSKAAQARLSMAQNKDAPSKASGLGRPRPSTTLGRSQSVRQSVAPRAEGASKRVPSNPTASTATVARPKSLKTSAGGDPREKKEAVIPHSKSRPISVSFPTPPPPAKSTKATTQSSFQLPGEAVAAKLKAAREARMAKEAEDAEKKDKKPAFRARPAPKTAGTVPSVRPTNASRARESIMSGKPAAAPTSHKRSNTVGAPITNPTRTTSKESTKPTTTTSSKPRPSTSLASLSKPRTSTAPATSMTAPQRAVSGSAATSKGKEVFSRATNAKAAADKAKAEKEAAAKKARAEAAERGRVASREWAEKQKARKLKAAGGDAKAGESKVEAPAISAAAGELQAGAGAAESREQADEKDEIAAEVEAVVSPEQVEAAAAVA